VPRQVNAVCNESKLSVKIAKAYLDKLMALKLGDETMSQLMRGLRARRTALELLSKLAKFIHELAEDGAIQEGQVDALLHELEHDAVHLRGNKAPTLDGTAGGSQGALPMSEVAQFVLELNKLREATLTELIEKGYAASVSKRFSFEKVPLEADHDKEVVKLAKTQGAEIIDASQVDATVRTARSRARRTWGRG